MLQAFTLSTATKRKLQFAFVFIALALICNCTSAIAQGDLLIYPKRLVFDGSKRSQEINLANSGKDTARYSISVFQVRMTEEGKFETITVPDSGQNFASDYFRFFPRSVTLAPNEAQTIKVQLVKTNALNPGEYRSHIYFRAELDNKPLGEEEEPRDTTTISVRLTPVFGISIPLIIKVGESTSQVKLSNMALSYTKDSLPVVQVKFERSGNMSVYGDIAVDHVAEDGTITRVAKVQGVAVYSPTPSRLFNILLDNSKGIDFRKGKLNVAYTEQTARGAVLAEDHLALK